MFAVDLVLIIFAIAQLLPSSFSIPLSRAVISTTDCYGMLCFILFFHNFPFKKFSHFSHSISLFDWVFFIYFAAHLREEDKVNLEDNFDLIQVLGTGGKRSMAFSTDHSVVLNKY